MNNKITYTILILVILSLAVFGYINYQFKQSPVSTQNPLVITEVDYSQQNINKLFTTIPEDTFPESTLEIPKDQWDTKTEALALRALKFFQSKGAANTLIPEDEIEFRKGYLMSWGKPWRLHYLKNELNDNEVRMIWEEQLLVQASLPEDLAKLEKVTQEKLARVNPPVEVKADLFKDYYSNQSDIDKAVTDGRLVKLVFNNAKVEGTMFVDKSFAPKIAKLDESLKDSKDVYAISSATRAVELQQLLRKLGYPAVKFSFHNLGNAIDFKLTKAQAEDFKKMLDEVQSDGTRRIDKIDPFIKGGTYPTMEMLYNQGLISREHAVTKAYMSLRDAAKKENIEVFDETPFFLIFDENGKLTHVNPVLHLQISK